MGGQFQDIAEQPQLRCDTRAQERQATYTGAVSGRLNYVPGFDSLFVAVPRPEPKNSSAAQGFGSFDLIARQEQDLLSCDHSDVGARFMKQCRKLRRQSAPTTVMSRPLKRSRST